MHDNPYLLLTPGPLSTSKTVRNAMLRDWCTWDTEYNVGIVQEIRRRLVELAVSEPELRDDYTAVLMQGSGTFSVEAAIGSTIPDDGKLLVLANGAYGQRIAKIASVLRIEHLVQDEGELQPTDLKRLQTTLEQDQGISHVAVVHGETTTGMLNPIEQIGAIVKRAGRRLIVDAMSTFGGIPINLPDVHADMLVSSANKCVQGVPGFGFVLAKTSYLKNCDGLARSLSLDLVDQWRTMEEGQGKWRFTSPTHTVRAFYQAIDELDEEGGVAVRHRRYVENQSRLVSGMTNLGFQCLLPSEFHSPIITAFYNPTSSHYTFGEFYSRLKERGFVIYPGKVTDVDTFRIGTIGTVEPEDIERLLIAVEESSDWDA